MNLDPFVRLSSPIGSLVSVYLNRPPGPSAAALTDVLKPLRAGLHGMERPTAMSVRSDLERISSLDSRIDADGSPAFCVFASDADGIFEFHPLPVPVWDHASVGGRPYLRPLRVLPEPIRAGVVVAERRQVEVYIAENGDLASLGDTILADLGKDNYGGFRGYDEQRARAHAEEEASRILREAAARLFEAHQERPLELIAVGGHQEALDALDNHLHPYLRRLPESRFVVDPHTLTPAELRSRVAEEASRLRQQRDEEAVTAILEAAGAGAPSALGTAAVLEAANAHAVDLLVVAGPFQRPGVRCPSCGWLARTGDTCPAEGASVEIVEDVVGAAMERVIEAGGSIRQVGVASPLDAKGVGALLRFPV